MLGEKRSQSLFAPKASAEKAAATHIMTGPDGRKKELPLYFGPDCPVSGNMGQNQHEAGVGEPQPADEPLRHAPADDGIGVEADPTDSVNMAEDLPRRSLNTESAGGYRAHSLFFTPENEGQDFNTVLQDVQEYISGKYSALITEGGDEDAKAQIKRYITKYVQDRRIAVKGYSGDQLVDALYTEMAEFGLLTKYIFGTGIEEINVNSWRDIEVLYANGETVKLEEHFDSPEHAVNVIRRMLHVSGITATINHGSYIPEALHVERIDDMALYDGDFEAAKAAEQDGVRLIYGMDGIPDGIYIDTPENRELIRKGLGLYPDYRNWRDDFDPSFVAELDVMQ